MIFIKCFTFTLVAHYGLFKSNGQAITITISIPNLHYMIAFGKIFVIRFWNIARSFHKAFGCQIKG